MAAFPFVREGSEHAVYHHEAANLAIKATYPNRFGHSMQRPGLAAATAVEYFDRWAAANQIFGDDAHVEAVLADDHGHVQIVMSQPWIAIDAAAPLTQEEIDRYMHERGFQRITFRGPPLYYHRELDLVAGDAHPENIVRTKEGVAVALDVPIAVPSEELRADLGLPPKVRT